MKKQPPRESSAPPPRPRLIKKPTSSPGSPGPEDLSSAEARWRTAVPPVTEESPPPRYQSRSVPSAPSPPHRGRPHPRPGPPRYQNEAEPIRRQYLGPRDLKGRGARPGRPKVARAKMKKPRPPRAHPPKPMLLTPEQRARVEEMYRAMVTRGERPPEGRRKKIAALLGLPYNLVADVVRNYLQHERLRRTNFDIEKIYWRELAQGQDDARAIAETAARELQLDVGRVWWWLEKLHEWRKSLTADPDVTDEQRAQIIAAYNDYLKQSEPPEMGLHKHLSEKIGGITPRQVHKTLLQYRLSFWNSLKNITPASA